jgi:hypothetical protein
MSVAGDEGGPTADDDGETARKFGRGVVGMLAAKHAQLLASAARFLRRGDLAQHAATRSMLVGLHAKAVEAAECYGVELPPELASVGGGGGRLGGPPPLPQPWCGGGAVLARAAAALGREGYATVDGFLEAELAAKLREEVLAMDAAGELRPGLIEGGRCEGDDEPHVLCACVPALCVDCVWPHLTGCAGPAGCVAIAWGGSTRRRRDATRPLGATWLPSTSSCAG